MNAEIIAVGSELLTPRRLDTNSLYLTGKLNELGIEVVAKAVIGDDRERLAEKVRAAAGRSEIVILTGGLGPTEDDVTRDAVAHALGKPLVYREELWEVLLLPGPPRELQPMFERDCLPRLRELAPAQVIRTLQFRVSGMPESELDQLISPIYKSYDNPVTTVLAAPGDIQIHLRARCDTAEEAEALLGEVGGRIEKLLGDRIYSRNGDPLETVVGQMLRARGATLAVAESCTGGMLAGRITSVGRFPRLPGGNETEAAGGRTGADPPAHRGQRTGGARNGRGGAGAHGRRLRLVGDRRGWSPDRRRPGPGGHGLHRAGRRSRMPGETVPVSRTTRPRSHTGGAGGAGPAAARLALSRAQRLGGIASRAACGSGRHSTGAARLSGFLPPVSRNDHRWLHYNGPARANSPAAESSLL